MNKLAVLLITAVCIVNVNAATISEILDNVDVEVSLKARSIVNNNYDFTKTKDVVGVLSHDDYVSYSDLKTEISLNTNITDDLSAHLQFELSEDVLVAGKEETLTPQWLQDNVELLGAYVEAKNLVNLLNLRLGRQEYGKEYKSFVAYFEKLDYCAVDLNLEPIQLTLLNGKIKDLTPKNRNGDQSIYGLSAQTGMPVGTLKFAVYGRTEEYVKAHTLSNVVWDVNAKGDIVHVAGLSYEAQLAYQTSQKLGEIGVKQDAFAGRLKGIYTLDTAAGKWRFAGEYLYTSGDKEGTANKYEAYTGVSPSYTPYDFKNGLKIKPISLDVKYGKELHNKNVFAVNVGFEPAAVENLSGNFYIAKWNYTQEVEKEKDIGFEFAVGADYVASDNVSLGALFGYFIPGKAIKEAIKKIGGEAANAIKLGAAVKMKF